jgi:hypothetical protein
MEHLERVQEQPLLVNDDKYILTHIKNMHLISSSMLIRDRFKYLYKNDNNYLLDIHISKLNIANLHNIK